MFKIAKSFIIFILCPLQDICSTRMTPSTLKDFGYQFHDQKLRRLDEKGDVTEEGFQFVDQAHYEALGQVIDIEVFRLLETDGELKRVQIGNSEPQSFVFCSEGFEKQDKLLVLIHGSGVVRAGQWARRLIINEDLNKGTMLPYIKHATSNGWGVVVMNTNMNTDDESNVIVGSETPEDHANTVWKTLISDSKAKDIVIVAHSYGGVVTMSLASEFHDDFLNRVNGIFMTDSVHYNLSGKKNVDEKLRTVGKNYVGSTLPVGTLIETRSSKDVPMYSAGHTKHEWTSYSAMEEIFTDMKNVLKQETKEQEINLKSHEGLVSHEL